MHDDRRDRLVMTNYLENASPCLSLKNVWDGKYDGDAQEFTMKSRQILLRKLKEVNEGYESYLVTRFSREPN
jgi:hypothetical protein